MCGIFALFTKKDICKTKIFNSALKISHRGEDATHAIRGKSGDIFYNMIFHRLAINGMTPESGQPLFYPANQRKEPYLYLMCNGEIYNHKQLEKDHQVECDSDSDCEIILHLYRKYGFTEAVKLLDGVFAIVLLDLHEEKVYTARDPYGVRGMNYLLDKDGFGVCSEIKGLVDLTDKQFHKPVHEFPAGHIMIYRYGGTRQSEQPELLRYFDHMIDISSLPQDVLMEQCSILFKTAIHKRLMCDRVTRSGNVSIGAFLSGGFDSSTVAAIACRELTKRGHKLHTFSIGFKGSPDLIGARQVADWIGSEHHEYVVIKSEMLGVIPKVIYQVETYDTTTVRASAFMYLLTEKIKKDFPDIVVLLSGEGSDEASGSYIYCKNAPDEITLHNETIRLLTDIRGFDARRGDRCTAGHNKEIRVPFLDKSFLQVYCSVPPSMKTQNGTEKWFLRTMFDKYFPDYLPKEIVWRPKEAMSDGVSLQEDSWFRIIQKYIKHELIANVFNHKYQTYSDLELEKDWYLSIFQNYYPGCKHIIPYYWEPKWTDVKDPSARLLDCYKS